jgi:mannitol-1-phosphate 5-dehydrogenase
MPLNDLVDHIKDLLYRFSNRALKDTCARVGADMERKLGPSDRLIGAMVCCAGQGVTPAFISVGAAAALYCLVKERGLEQTEENSAAILEETSKLKKDSEEAGLIFGMYNRIRSGQIDLKKMIQCAFELGKKAVI